MGNNTEDKDKDKEECFSGSNYIICNGQKLYLSDVKNGEDITTLDKFGEITKTKIYCITHNEPKACAVFKQISTTTKRITPSFEHYLIVVTDGTKQYKMAKDVQVDDILITFTDGEIQEEAVMDVKDVEEKGVFNVFTQSGDMFVNGILASCYAVVKPEVAHKAVAPIRAISKYAPSAVTSTILKPNKKGIPFLFNAALSLTPYLPK